jgi:hypothetical protein
VSRQFLTPITLTLLEQNPANPIAGQIYYNTQEQTIKAYNGIVWYDVAGPKEILEHTHGIDGAVDEVLFADYVDEDRVFANSGNVASSFIGDYIDGGNASGN